MQPRKTTSRFVLWTFLQSSRLAFSGSCATKPSSNPVIPARSPAPHVRRRMRFLRHRDRNSMIPTLFAIAKAPLTPSSAATRTLRRIAFLRVEGATTPSFSRCGTLPRSQMDGIPDAPESRLRSASSPGPVRRTRIEPMKAVAPFDRERLGEFGASHSAVELRVLSGPMTRAILSHEIEVRVRRDCLS